MISFFHLPKPRQFKYRPRYYDPEMEKFEELRKKYQTTESLQVDDEMLKYYRNRVRSIEKEQASSGSSLFKKKTVPKFNYQPRFASNKESVTETPSNKIEFKSIYEERRTETETFPSRTIIISIVVVLLLLLWIFF